jgi:PPM family protein phosphatase
VNQFVDIKNLEVSGSSHVGRRDHNEDAYLIDRELGLFVVADGVGGHQSGEVASAITCEVLQREIAAGADLRQAIDRANTEVIAAVQSGRGKSGMGSTVVAVLMTENGYDLAWVGDSRVYLWDGKLSLLTRDHSFVETQLASGQITLEEARTHPRRHVILQAVGAQASGDLEIGTNSGQLAANSCLLLCSDGITDPLDSEQLCQLLIRRSSTEETCERMVNMALQCGGRDNITAVLIAHNGTQEDSARITAPAQVVWVYDPETAVYAGLPEVTLRHPDVGGEVEKTQVLRVRSGSVSSGRPMVIAAGEKVKANRGWRYFWLAALLGIVALVLAYLMR